jgi:hypothetical protein
VNCFADYFLYFELSIYNFITSIASTLLSLASRLQIRAFALIAAARHPALLCRALRWVVEARRYKAEPHRLFVTTIRANV